MDWPARSPDLNPIEHIWDIMSHSIHQSHVAPQTVQELADALVQVWEEIPQETIRHLIRSMPRRCREVIQARDTLVPTHWDDMKGSFLKLVNLSPRFREYNDVKAECVKTGINLTIVKIEQVQNEILWKNYQIQKKQMEEKNNHYNNERLLLFYGTSSNSISQINNHGLNCSYEGTHGAEIAIGSYFAVNPLFSPRGYVPPDAQGFKCMYLARVLVGDYTQGHPGWIIPPAKPSGRCADLYDSVTDNTSIPTTFLIFNDVQAYPEFLITFN
uniref:Poly [ADP-ribose] polymerase n=1 Tax=Salmo trutta TaxID=8032 RepID=A0A673YCS7_SALTR